MTPNMESPNPSPSCESRALFAAKLSGSDAVWLAVISGSFTVCCFSVLLTYGNTRREGSPKTKIYAQIFSTMWLLALAGLAFILNLMLMRIIFCEVSDTSEQYVTALAAFVGDTCAVIGLFAWIYGTINFFKMPKSRGLRHSPDVSLGAIAPIEPPHLFRNRETNVDHGHGDLPLYHTGNSVDLNPGVEADTSRWDRWSGLTVAGSKYEDSTMGV